jgi:hypothetical protein
MKQLRTNSEQIEEALSLGTGRHRHQSEFKRLGFEVKGELCA